MKLLAMSPLGYGYVWLKLTKPIALFPTMIADLWSLAMCAGAGQIATATTVGEPGLFAGG